MGFEAFAKNLAVDLGGSKRLHALSTLASGLILLLMYFVDLMSGSDMIPFWSNVFTLLFVTIFGFVLDYYIDSICLKRFEHAKVARIGTSSVMFAALLYTMLWTTEETPSTTTLMAYLLIYLGVLSLTSMEKASGGGSFVGYSSDGLPLFSFSDHFSPETYVPMWRNILKSTSSVLKQIQEDAISRLFYFSVLTMLFTCIEFLYGTLTNSLSLISDGFHMLFDSMALCIGLSASVICRWKPSKTYPFGYGRIEVLSGFLNSFFLLVIASIILIEALQRLYDPPGVDAKRLLPISIIGLLVNLVGIYTFRSNSVFLHILADTIGSIGVITSSILIHNYGLLVADPICSMIIATLIVISVVPLLKETSKMLLLAVPSGLEKNLQQTVLQILTTEGVKGYRNPRFWTHAPSVFTGSIHAGYRRCQ
ncbi:Zinc transporter 5 [Orchesella cincta]|uniref:Proton-coupled zinc antiporter SLC30A5 n=1 Tax=Orchesella cincta TaxID=48709 RepID=A0A1D2MN89_ORCCI|nr:Zinc transporter 5 [Orchesella cincta]